VDHATWATSSRKNASYTLKSTMGSASSTRLGGHSVPRKVAARPRKGVWAQHLTEQSFNGINAQFGRQLEQAQILYFARTQSVILHQPAIGAAIGAARKKFRPVMVTGKSSRLMQRRLDYMPVINHRLPAGHTPDMRNLLGAVVNPSVARKPAPAAGG
jgi:hypothetical protein